MDDLDRGKAYIAKDNRRAAVKMVKRIKERVKILNEYPSSGRKGREKDTFELVVMDTPYIIVYEISNSVIFILRVMHHSQQWPPTEKTDGLLSFDW